MFILITVFESCLADITFIFLTLANRFLSRYLFSVLKLCVACGETVMANCILQNLQHERQMLEKKKKTNLSRDPCNLN